MNVSFWAALIHHESKISGGSIVFKFEIWWRYVKTSNLTSHRSAWFPLLSACWFVEFDTSIICHVLLYCFGSFLSQDLFKYSLLRDKTWACCLLAFYIVAPGPLWFVKAWRRNSSLSCHTANRLLKEMSSFLQSEETDWLRSFPFSAAQWKCFGLLSIQFKISELCF